MSGPDVGGDAFATPRHRRLGVPSNLPGSPSSFVGRSDDIARIGRLLTTTRALTLTGAGGCGKTRLGEQAAALVAPRFPGGVWWVELAAVVDGGLVADVLARVLDLQPEGRPAVDVVVEHVVDAEMLVVLDNCEHVVDDVAILVDRLLRGTGAVRVVATSRRPLGVAGETTWRVPSMTVPPPGCTVERLRDFDASRLFLERLDQSRPDATPEETAVAICRRLDGIPLALELAAARARTMSLGRIVAELDDRFGLLTEGPRGAPARHRTLLASVQWSYDLLDDEERSLLRRLAVFVDGFGAEAATAVAGFDPLPPDVLDVLTRLVDRSLVQFDAVRDRYRLLETIREFGAERLDVAGEVDVVTGRHLRWACALAEGLDEAMTRADLDALDAAETELANLRVALDHAERHGADEVGLRLVVALAFFWAQRGLGLEGGDRASRVLAAHPDAPGALRGRAWAAAAYDVFYGGDFDAAAVYADRGLAEATAAGDRRGQARNRHVHGAVAFLLDPPAGRVAMSEAIGHARACGDLWCETDALQILGFSHLIQHRPGPAQEAVLRSAAMAADQGNAFQLACHHLDRGMTAAAAGRVVEAARSSRRGADEAQRIGDPIIELWGRAGQLTTALARRRFAELGPIADQTAATGRPLPAVPEAFVAGLRRAVGEGDHPHRVLAVLEEVAELLRTTFVPNEGLRLALIVASGALAHGDPQGAEATVTATLERATTFGSALVGPCRVLLARVRRRAGDDPSVVDRLAHDGLAEIHDAGLVIDLPDALEAVAGASLDLDAAAPAARLLGAATALREALELPGAYPTDAAADLAAARRVLADRLAVHVEEGRAMTAEAAVAYARRSRGGRKRPATGWAALTPTEFEVARLAGRGLTNPDIGAEMFIARGTVKTHLEHVYAKLGLRNRAELAAALSRRSAGQDPARS